MVIFRQERRATLFEKYYKNVSFQSIWAQKSLCYKVRLLERFSTIVDRLCFVVGKLSLLILVLCREQGSKSFMICLLLFQLFMGSFSGLDDMLENEEANFGWWLLWFVLFSSIFCSACQRFRPELKLVKKRNWSLPYTCSKCWKLIYPRFLLL